MPNEYIKKTKEEAWKFYNEWREAGSFCPAFDSNIVISRKGWNHITGVIGHKRKWKDVYRRLKLLPEAKELIEKSTTIQNIKRKKSITYYAIEGLVKTKAKKGLGYKKVRVIFIEDSKKNKIFLSVMDKND